MKQLDPKSVWLFFINSVLLSFLLVIFLGGIGFPLFNAEHMDNLDNGISGTEFSFAFLNWLWIIIPALIVCCFVWAKLTYRFYRYELTDLGFRKELGVINKQYVTIPYDRIQNVNINRGLIARMFGLSDLQIQTAGVGTAIGEGRLPALSQETAEQLRNEVIKRARQSKNQGL